MLFIACECDLNDLHIHHSVSDLGKEMEESADGRVAQVIVAQHIPAARNTEPAVLRGDLAFCVGNGKVSADILYLRVLYPCFEHQLYRLLICGVKYEHAAREGISHFTHERPHLIGQKIVENACGVEDRAVGGVDLIEPRSIIEVARYVFLAFSVGKQLIACRNNIGKVQIVNPSATVAAISARVVQSAAEIYDSRAGMRLKIVAHLKGEVVLSHCALKKAEALHKAPRLFLKRRKIVVYLFP